MNVMGLIAKRILFAVVTLLSVSVLIFAAIETIPGDAATRFLGRDATADAIAVLREQMQLNQPAYVRYFRWLGLALSGDLGESLTGSRPVSVILGPRVANTVLLSTIAFAIHLPLVLIPASLAAVYRDRPLDQAISLLNLIAVSMPSFLIATLLLVAFVVVFPLFPAVSSVSEGGTWPQYFRAVALPSLTLAIVMAAHAIRILRDNLIEVLASDYVRTAELKGLPRRVVLVRHALPNALGPTLNVTALNMVYLVSGVVIVEKVFAFPGFGSLLVDSLLLADTPLIQATVLISAAVYIFANLLADVASMLLNPRLRDG